MRIEWNKNAQKQFSQAIEYISNDSEQNAEKVGRIVPQMINKLSENPERYGLEKYKQPNDGSYHYFIKYQYRVSFHIQKNLVRIIRILHQKRKPSFL